MNKILIAFMATAALFTLGACKKKGGASEAIAKVKEFSGKMCECKDKACADKVNEEYTKWGAEMAKNAKPEDAKSVSAEDTKAMTEAATKYSECYTKLAMAGAGGGAAGGGAAGGDTAGSAAAGSDTAGSAAAGGDSGGSAAAGSGSAEEKKEDAPK
jgi:hypothetical protein